MSIVMKWVFRYFSEIRKIEYLKEQGIMLGSRVRAGRKVYLYMLKDFFVEVVYDNDDIDRMPEQLETFSNLGTLNSYLEREFRTSF